MSARLDRLARDVARNAAKTNAGMEMVKDVSRQIRTLGAGGWKVGQTVGQEYGHYAKELRRSTVERVTPRGGALVNGKFYTATGRPYQRYGTPIFAWTDEHEARWRAQEAKAKRQAAALKAARTRARNERQADREAIDFGLELLKNRVDGPIVKRLSDILRRVRPEEESDR